MLVIPLSPFSKKKKYSFQNSVVSGSLKLKSCIRFDQGLSDYFPCTDDTRQLYSWYPAVVQLVPGSCTFDTRQGCGASPLLFCLVINDLVNHLKNSFDKGIFISEETCDLYALMYADDISSTSNSSIQLQRQINCIADFCDKVKLKVNIDKTKIVLFRNGGPL